jgi:CheY-like chemotaxis protein
VPGDAPSTADRREDAQILIVDDEPAVRRLAGRMLGQLGFTAVEAADGAQAVEALWRQPERFALVLLDLTIPGLDVEEFLAKIERDGLPVPVVICSGYGAQDVEARFSGRAVAGFLQKPFGLENLRTALRDALPAR